MMAPGIAPQVMTGTPQYAPQPFGPHGNGMMYGQQMAPPTPQQQQSMYTHPFNGASTVGGVGAYGTPSHHLGGGGAFGTPSHHPGGGGAFGTPSHHPGGGGAYGTPSHHPGGGGGLGTPSHHPGGGGGAQGTPSHHQHTHSSMHHTPKGPTGPFFPGNGKENAVNTSGGGYYASLAPSVAGLARGLDGLDIRAASSSRQNSHSSSFRGGNDDLSSIGASTTVEILNQRPKRTEDQLLDEGISRDHWNLLDIQNSKVLLDGSRESAEFFNGTFRHVSTLVLDNVPPNPLIKFKGVCKREESIYEEEKQRYDSDIKEIEGSITTGQEDLEEEKTSLRGKSQAKKTQVDVEYDDKTAKLQSEIAELESRLQGLPKEREAAKKRVDVECDTKIANLQQRNEEQDRALNRKLKKYQKAKQKLREQKAENLAYPMAIVVAIELTHDILKMYLKMYENKNSNLMDKIDSAQDKLQRLLNAIDSHEIGTLYDIVWNFSDVDDTD